MNIGQGHREQINELTSYLDASMVYGSTKRKADQLRQHKRGRMATGPDDTLPIDRPGTDCLLPSRGHTDRRCFAAGEVSCLGFGHRCPERWKGVN